MGVERPVYETPRAEELSATAPVSNAAISTSGDAHNFFRDDQGRVYCHILDPTTGRPVHNNLASVTVIAKKGVTADGLATTLFVLGPERGLRWVEAHPDVAALFIVRSGDNDFRIVASKRFPSLQMPTQN